MINASGRHLLAALEAALRFEQTPLWVPLVQARSLGDQLFDCTFALRTARRGGWAGREVVINETFEGAAAQCGAEWAGLVRLVQSVDIVGNVAFTVRVTSGRAPAPGDKVQIYPEPFLKGARDWLAADDAARGSLDLTAELTKRLDAGPAATPRRQQPAPGPAAGPLGRRATFDPPLRTKQVEAVDLAGSPLGVCWGPPGTGKTTTLAALVAGLAASGQRVLVVAPTNVAADGACLAIDRLLTELTPQRVRGDVLRVQTPQLASQFRDQNPDLLVWDDEQSRFTDALMSARTANQQARARLLTSFGVAADDALRAIASASETEEALRQRWKARQRELIANALVVVSTVRTAINRCLADRFSHLVVDEASMVSIADGLILAWQQRAAPTPSLLLFGDHKQLGPIVPTLRQEGEDSAPEQGAAAPGRLVKEWFGTDILSWVYENGGRQRMVMLEEQSRMNPLLCAVVSAASYEGRLRAVNAPPGGLPPALPAGICVLDHTEPPAFLTTMAAQTALPFVSPGQSPTMPSSAKASVALARYLDARGWSVVVCTPFRGQASLIQRGLADLPSVRSGTIHRMQGQEADVCIFDPCQATRWFITTAPEAPRLVNVAASRAKHALVLSNAVEYMKKNHLLMPYLQRARLIT